MRTFLGLRKAQGECSEFVDRHFLCVVRFIIANSCFVHNILFERQDGSLIHLLKCGVKLHLM